jgi:membrane fusion protein (multidrug efflux system)
MLDLPGPEGFGDPATLWRGALRNTTGGGTVVVSRARTLILLVIALDLTGCHENGQRPPDNARKITVALVQSKSATIKHEYECTAYSQHFMEVRAPADGYLAEVSVKEGQSAKKGDPAFRIRPAGAEDKSRAVDGEQAASAEVGQAVTANDLLFRLPPREDTEKPKAGNPEGVISIRAPFDGVIGRLTRRPDRFVRKDDLLTRVVRTSVIWAYFKVPEEDYLESATEWSREQQSQQVKLILADQSEFPHAGQSCGPQGGSNEDPDHIPFLAKFPNPDGLVRSGRSGTVSVSREWKNAIFLPRRATFGDPDGRYVYFVGKDHVAHRRAIVTGDGTADFLVIKEGVGVGDRIVVDGVGQIRDGDKVD